MKDFKKVVRLGKYEEYNGRHYSIFCKIELKEGKLSISGVEGPKANGDCFGACGQINMDRKAEDITPAPGWTRLMLIKFFNAWGAWHLNDLTAGSPDQELAIVEYKKHHKYDYTEAKNWLKEQGLEPDPNYMHEGKPYSYGTAWLSTEVPEDVLEFLSMLPDTDETPAWV